MTLTPGDLAGAGSPGGWASRGAVRAAGVLVGLALLLLLLGGCSTGGSGSAPSTTIGSAVATAIPEGFGVVTVVVTRSDGTTQELCMWLAATDDQRQQGLMGVTDAELGGKQGMVFDFDGGSTAAFFMRNTLLPLSIAWYDAAGALVSTADMDPCPPDVETCPTYPPEGRYRIAVEVPQGRLGPLGLVDGSTVSLADGCDGGPRAS